MAQQTLTKRSAAAAASGTDTTLFTPAAGQKCKLLLFFVTNEVAAQAAGMLFEIRYGSNIIAAVGFNSATAVVGQTSQIALIAHEFIGDGVTAVVARNLTTLAATSIAVYVCAFDSGY